MIGASGSLQPCRGSAWKPAGGGSGFSL